MKMHGKGEKSLQTAKEIDDYQVYSSPSKLPRSGAPWPASQKTRRNASVGQNWTSCKNKNWEGPGNLVTARSFFALEKYVELKHKKTKVEKTKPKL